MLGFEPRKKRILNPPRLPVPPHPQDTSGKLLPEAQETQITKAMSCWLLVSSFLFLYGQGRIRTYCVSLCQIYSLVQLRRRCRLPLARRIVTRRAVLSTSAAVEMIAAALPCFFSHTFLL